MAVRLMTWMDIAILYCPPAHNRVCPPSKQSFNVIQTFLNGIRARQPVKQIIYLLETAMCCIVTSLSGSGPSNILIVY